MGCPMGLEPTTLGITTRYSNQLNYGHHIYFLKKQADYINNIQFVKTKLHIFLAFLNRYMVK